MTRNAGTKETNTVKMTKVNSGSSFEEGESYSRIVAPDHRIVVSNSACKGAGAAGAERIAVSL